MGNIKNLNDVIYGDRADVNKAKFKVDDVAKTKDFSSSKVYERCYWTHPALPLLNGQLFGGACADPIVKGANAYIGFDYKVTIPPYDYTVVPAAHSILLPIADMHGPKDIPAFKKLVTWVVGQLQEGKNLHCGCIGGHGRTGTFFSAVVCEALGEKNAIEYVREHYCKKAVESLDQVKFLGTHYGILPATGYKEGSGSHGSKMSFKPGESGKSGETYHPIGSSYSIFKA